MSHRLAWLCLIVALSGPSLAHAEAADDLARSLIGGGEQGRVEPIDGGVGDEPVEASRAPASPQSGPSDPAGLPSPDLATDPGPGRFRSIPAPGSLRHRAALRGDPGPTRRHVWLQIFRI